jgi:gamma-glutamylputrescine oxidase
VYDLIIIGGGMSGISIAHFFAQQNILLLEKQELLSGASGNNAGFLITGFGEHFHRTAERWGKERASEIQRIHLSAHRRIRDLTNETETTGSLSVGLTDKESKELKESFELMRTCGFPVKWVDNANTGLRETKPALLNPDDGLLDSRRFWQELATRLPFQTNSEVLEVIQEQDGVRVVTTSQEFKAKRIIYCMNAYSNHLLSELSGRIIPLRAQMLEIEIFDPAPCMQPVIAEYGEIYWNFSGNMLRFGGLEYMIPDDEVGIARSLSAGVLDAQLQWIRKNFNVSHAGIPLRTWFGTMGFTVDGFPIVGELPDRKNQYVLAGMCGLGHSYALECASWIYELIVNDRNIIPSYFSSDRIINLPRYSGGDWRTLYEAWNH